jgi:hypothetical protein
MKLFVKVLAICSLFEASGIAVDRNLVLLALTLSLLGGVTFGIFFRER